MATTRGKVSWFGGPNDMGVSPDEGLAFIYEVDDAPYLFLPVQPPGTTGLARRLDPSKHYIACRWDYRQTPKPTLLNHTALVRSPMTNRKFEAYPADWGPNINTGRVADISPGLMEALGIETDDEVEVTYPYRELEQVMAYKQIVISSGHGKYVRGAAGILDEVDEARKVVERVAMELKARGLDIKIFHDNTSKSQGENLATIIKYHNDQERDLDVSVHFNAFEQTSKPRGTEVLYLTQASLAGQVSAAIATSGLINRGAKKRTDLSFLNRTDEPAILIEVCFVDSEADAQIYRSNFIKICDAIANVLGGPSVVLPEPKPPVVQPPVPVALPRVDIEVSGEVLIFVNGEQVGTKG